MSTSQAEVFLDFVSSAFLLTQHQKTRKTGSLFYTFTKYEQYNIPQANALLRIATQPELQIQLARFIAGAIFVRPTKRTSLVGLADPIQQNSMRYTSIVMSVIFISSTPLLFHRLVCTNPVDITWCVESKNLNKALCFFFYQAALLFSCSRLKKLLQRSTAVKKKKRKEKMALHSYNLPKVLIPPGHQYCSIQSMAL